MAWRGPEYEGEFPSLGWDLIDFWELTLRVPAGPLYGQLLRLTDDQKQFYVRLYALRPDGADAARVYRRASRVGPKGKGKSPEGGLFVIGEFAGPVQFDGWDANGEPVGRPRDYPWVQIAAVSEEQDHNLYGPLREMLADSDLSADNGGPVDLGKTRIEFKDGRPGKIEPVSASAGSREGQPITAAAMEETGLWFPSAGGVKLAATLRRNASKTNGTTVEFTNPPALGEGSVAEASLAASEKGQSGLLFDQASGFEVDDLKDPANRAKVVRSLRQAYDDGSGKRPVPWVDVDRIYDDLLDVDTTEADGLRFFLGLNRKADNRAFSSKAFDGLAESRPTRGWSTSGYEFATIGPSPVADDVPVLLMFDGARTRDSAVLTAWTLEVRPHHFHVASWERPPNPAEDYEHPRGEIRAAVREFVASHDVAMFAFDSSFHELNSLYDEWRDEHGDVEPGTGSGLMVGYPTSSGKRMEQAIKRMLEDTREAAYSHDGHDVVTRHVHNAVLTKNRGGWQMLAKEKDALKIDAAVTMTFGYDLIAEARTFAEGRSSAPFFVSLG